MLARALAIVTLAACGGADKPATGTAPDPAQTSLAIDVAKVCAAPTRAEADPQFGDAAARIGVLSQHLSDGVTHKDVIAAIERWRSDKLTTEQRNAELADLVQRAGLVTPCRLADVWADASWGASELAQP
jgi:hypothetical protein